MDWLIFGSINIIIMVLMFLFLSRRLHRQYNNANFLKEIQQEVNAIITELNQTTERNVHLIEERMEAVQVLISQLDRRITLARSEESQRSESQTTYSRIKEQRRLFQREMASPTPVQAELVLDATVRPPELDSDSVAHVSAPAVQTPQVPQQSPPPQTAPSVREPNAVRQALSRDARKNQVVEMFRAGIATPTIAQHIGMSLGEVELIISLQG